MLFGRSAQLQIETAAGLLGERTPPGSASSRKAYSMMSWSKPRPSMPRRARVEQRALHVAGDLGHGGAFQVRLQVRQVFGADGARFTGSPRQPDGVHGEFAFGRFGNGDGDGAPSGTAAIHDFSSSSLAMTR
jgi:hypothetical protein